jgi:hypothetical protein
VNGLQRPGSHVGVTTVTDRRVTVCEA